MIGITEDHQFKTRDGWKYFHEIENDELYCWKFVYYDGQEYGLINYRERLMTQNKQRFYEPCQSFIKPLQKHFYLSNDRDLFEIKNEHMDLITTNNYLLPVARVDYDDRYGNYNDVMTIDSILKQVNKGNDDFGIYAFSETLTTSSDCQLDEIMFKLESTHFKKITTRNTSIVCFTMPDVSYNNEESCRIYVRRNGKEFWV